MSDTDTYIARLTETNPLREPTLRAALRALALPTGSRGLDVGCGIGFQTLLLAEAVGPAGHVTGLDVFPELLAHARRVVAGAGAASRISFAAGDMYRLPFEDRAFDWAWSVDCAGYPAGDLLPVLNELMRVVRPGGTIALLGWSSQQFLPGYPVLESSLNAAFSAYAPFLKEKLPEAHFARALAAFRAAGLPDAVAQTLVGEVQAPLDPAVRRALTSLIGMLWTEPPEETPQIRAEYLRLCDPASPDYILNLRDYYAFFTYTMFRARVPA